MDFAKKTTSGDEEKLKAAAVIIEECVKLEGDADPCEAAVKIGFCLKTNGEKMKLMFGM